MNATLNRVEMVHSPLTPACRELDNRELDGQEPNGRALLVLRDLSVSYPDGTLAVQIPSLTIHEGQRVALVGANGAGKTSLLLSLVGVIPAKGYVEVDGITLARDTLDTVRQRMGLVFQNPDDQLFMHAIFDDVAFGLRNRDLPEEEVALRVHAMLEQLRMTHLRDRSVLKLSGGEKRLAALATVLVMEPSVMLLDEPTVYLDPRARRNLISLINNLDKTMVIATHDLSFAARTCSRVVVLKNGMIFADGSPQRILRDAALMEACGLEIMEEAR